MIRVTTVGELGASLPIGFGTPGGKLDKAFSLRPYKSRVDRQLGLWRTANESKYQDDRGQLTALLVAKFLSLMVEAAGGNALPLLPNGDSTPEGELMVHRWAFSDVMYAYYYARVQSLGHELVLPCVCPNGRCRWVGQAEFDLRTTAVRVAESTKDTQLWLELKRPFKLGDERTLVRSVKLSPITWATATRPGVLISGVHEMSYNAVLDSITAINNDDTPRTLTEADLDQMERVDRVRINKVADEVSAGLDMRTSVQCPKCAALISDALNWSFDSFFGDSVPLGT